MGTKSGSPWSSNEKSQWDSTKLKFEEERVQRERSSQSVHLTSVVIARQNSGTTWGDFAPRTMGPQSSMGFGKNKNQASECGENLVWISCWSQCNVGAYVKTSRRARIRCRFRSIDADAEKKFYAHAPRRWFDFLVSGLPQRILYFSLDILHWHPSMCRRSKKELR